MKLLRTSFTVLLLLITTQARVLLSRHQEADHQTQLFTHYPRYLVPKRSSTQTDLPTTNSQQEKILLDNSSPQERKLFMMTDYEAQKKRFGQRMDCIHFECLISSQERAGQDDQREAGRVPV